MIGLYFSVAWKIALLYSIGSVVLYLGCVFVEWAKDYIEHGEHTGDYKIDQLMESTFGKVDADGAMAMWFFGSVIGALLWPISILFVIGYGIVLYLRYDKLKKKGE